MTDDQRQNVKLWIEALRSGRYKQGSYRLEAEGKFCCLGVACNLYQEIGPGDLEVSKWRDIVSFGNPGGPMLEAILPTQVSRWLGLRETQGGFVHQENGLFDALSAMNDRHITFDEIAAFIEQCLQDNTQGLFVD